MSLIGKILGGLFFVWLIVGYGLDLLAKVLMPTLIGVVSWWESRRSVPLDHDPRLLTPRRGLAFLRIVQATYLMPEIKGLQGLGKTHQATNIQRRRLQCLAARRAA